jgi:predicted nuclease of restriction endonuclease-like (RecB) superfamily
MIKAVKSSAAERKFYAEIAQILYEGRKSAYTAVNSIMVNTSWRTGKRIVEEEQKGKDRADYGEFLIQNLSRYLGENFGKGFSEANLRNFRQFYLTFQNDQKRYTLCSVLGWSHAKLIMRLGSKKAMDYYLKEAQEQSWSVRTLERNIKSRYYERLLAEPAKRKRKTKSAANAEILEYIKDPYILEFLGLPENIQGKEDVIEQAVISNLQKFLLELGKGFSFVGRQFRISTETSHFYIDLVFYNYLLKCFVVIDLKTRKLTHQDIGQMDMYVRMFDDLKRGKGDNPTIGVILCTDKDETIAKYSVMQENKRIFASKYKQVLPTEEELAARIDQGKQRFLEVRERYFPDDDDEYYGV